ncbi:hypothetical protein [Ornithinibacillus scapharcae]|uniref:hypothetical protein n=1 Tax=Ornithinibacillus scapharcae TaxID=1147159 RepID=UPI000225B086|nr:hypothetical protein [Ornithinibacillus scapharcae]
MRFACLLLILITLSSCVKETISVHDKSPYAASEANIKPSSMSVTNEVPSEYFAITEGELMMEDAESAFEMCIRALDDYYKAVWNGSEINLDTYIDNERLKKYTQEKIQSQYELHHHFDTVQGINPGEWQVELMDDEEGGFLYLHLPVQINMTVGSYGEVTEFLIRNVEGKLVIVDWYTGAKDSYDFMVRGENVTIDNPDFWNVSELVKEIERKQVDF